MREVRGIPTVELYRRSLGALTGGAFAATLFLAPELAHAQAVLKGIRCQEEPTSNAQRFSMPVRDGGGVVWNNEYNPFGIPVSKDTDKDLASLPPGWWQHTGVDWGVRGGGSGRQPIYAIGAGVVVFSTSTPGQSVVLGKEQRDLTRRRGGAVIIKHTAPAGQLYELPAYSKRFKRGSVSATVSYPSLRTRSLYSYYLHLDPNAIEVTAGDDVTADRRIGRLFNLGEGYLYDPHLHFELWISCPEEERNGYDQLGPQFEAAVNAPLLDANALWKSDWKLVKDPLELPGFSLGYVAADVPDLPEDVKRVVDRAVPGWSFPRWVERNDYDICYRGKGTPKLNPFMVTGDFDGDGKTDYALSISSPEGLLRRLTFLVVFADRRVAELHVGSTSETSTGLLIGLSKTGSRITNVSGTPIKLTTDAPTMIFCEQSSRSYVYQRQTKEFEEIWTTD